MMGADALTRSRIPAAHLTGRTRKRSGRAAYCGGCPPGYIWFCRHAGRHGKKGSEMMFKARLGRVLAGAFGAILAFAMTGTAYAATTPGVEVVSETSTVTVHVYNNNNNPTAVEGTGSEVADASTTLGTAIDGATLSYYKVGELVQYTTNGSTSLKYAVSESAATSFGWSTSEKTVVTINNGTDVKYYLFDASELSKLLDKATSSDLKGKVDAGSWTDLTTGENGSAATSDTLSGLYLFVGKSMPSQVTTEVAPFFVSAPMPGNTDWNTNIHVYPKVQTANDITILKQVRYASSTNEGDYTQSMSANAGIQLQYRITVKVPGNVKNLDSLTVEDVIPSGLELVPDSIDVTADKVSLNQNDYDLDSTGKITFSLKDDVGLGLDKFDTVTEDAIIYITYNAKINNTASLAESIKNTATLNYQFENATAKDPTESTATVYTYGIDLTKTFEDATAYPIDGNTQFSLYTDQDCTNAVVVSGSDGSYWVDSSSSTTAMDVAQIETTPDGTLTIKGLAAGTYYLKEVAAPGGYGKLQEPIKIVIDKGASDDLATAFQNPTATVNGVEATIKAGGSGEKAGLVQLTVENQKLLFGFLPQTGDTGTLIATAAGIGMIALAIIFVAGRRSKSSAR